VSLRNTQKPLGSMLSSKETASVFVAVPAGTQPSSVITATYDAGGAAPIASNKTGSINPLSPIDGASTQPVELETDRRESLLRDFLVMVGECANCSSDLYADETTAEALQEHAHSGACVMCGYGVSYVNTGQSARIATDCERSEMPKTEIANYFDFSDLSTVDPNKLEENDMSNKQARAALLANVASVMREINERAASKPEDDNDEQIVLASDDEDDFADEAEDSEELETLDMDESDPAEDDEDDSEDDSDSEDESEDEEAAETPAEASDDDNTEAEMATDTNTAPEAVVAEVPVVESTDSVVTTPETAEEVTTEEQPAAAVETPVAEVTPEVVAETAEEAPAAETTEEPATVETPEVTTAETAEEIVSDEAPIEYVATTPALLSPDAELVPVGETAYYVVQDNSPVAVLRKENASAGAQSLWGKPTEIRNSYRAAMSGDNRETALAQLGGSILRHSTTVSKVIAERVADRETAAATEIAAEREAITARYTQSLETAALGIVKGLFGANYANPVAAELATVLANNGVREPEAIVRASMIKSMPSLVELTLKKAAELAEASEDVRETQADLVGKAEFIAPVAATLDTIPAAAAAAPVAETASAEPKAKPKIDIAKLTAGLGRNVHSFAGVR
jgi:hypothetical protein